MKMEGQSKLFCNQCGKELEYNSQFCRHCGAIVTGTPADEARKNDFKRMEEAANEGRITLITFLIAIYAIPAFIFAIYAVFNIDHITNSLWNDDAIHKVFIENNITQSMVHDAVTAISYMMLVSGLAAVASGVLCFLRRYWLVAVVCCFIAAVLCVWSIFGAIIGIFVGWFLISAKPSFDTPRFP